jgi:hypothetical protein
MPPVPTVTLEPASTTAAGAPSEDSEGAGTAWDLVDEWGAQSFPASDPPANW